MDGGRVEKIYSDVETPMPKEVDKFRTVVNNFKRLFIESLEKDSDHDDIQNVKRLKNMLDRVQHLGNILKLLLSSEDVSDQLGSLKEIDPILDTFAKGGFTFDNISDEARELCIHYIKNDIEMYPFDLNHHSSKHTKQF